MLRRFVVTIGRQARIGRYFFSNQYNVAAAQRSHQPLTEHQRKYKGEYAHDRGCEQEAMTQVEPKSRFQQAEKVVKPIGSESQQQQSVQPQQQQNWQQRSQWQDISVQNQNVSPQMTQQIKSTTYYYRRQFTTLFEGKLGQQPKPMGLQKKDDGQQQQPQYDPKEIKNPNEQKPGMLLDSQQSSGFSSVSNAQRVKEANEGLQQQQQQQQQQPQQQQQQSSQKAADQSQQFAASGANQQGYGNTYKQQGSEAQGSKQGSAFEEGQSQKGAQFDAAKKQQDQKQQDMKQKQKDQSAAQSSSSAGASQQGYGNTYQQPATDAQRGGKFDAAKKQQQDQKQQDLKWQEELQTQNDANANASERGRMRYFNQGDVKTSETEYPLKRNTTEEPKSALQREQEGLKKDYIAAGSKGGQGHPRFEEEQQKANAYQDNSREYQEYKEGQANKQVIEDTKPSGQLGSWGNLGGGSMEQNYKGGKAAENPVNQRNKPAVQKSEDPLKATEQEQAASDKRKKLHTRPEYHFGTENLGRAQRKEDLGAMSIGTNPAQDKVIGKQADFYSNARSQDEAQKLAQGKDYLGGVRGLDKRVGQDFAKSGEDNTLNKAATAGVAGQATDKMKATADDTSNAAACNQGQCDATQQQDQQQNQQQQQQQNQYKSQPQQNKEQTKATSDKANSMNPLSYYNFSTQAARSQQQEKEEPDKEKDELSTMGISTASARKKTIEKEFPDYAGIRTKSDGRTGLGNDFLDEIQGINRRAEQGSANLSASNMGVERNEASWVGTEGATSTNKPAQNYHDMGATSNYAADTKPLKGADSPTSATSGKAGFHEAMTHTALGDNKSAGAALGGQQKGDLKK